MKKTVSMIGLVLVAWALALTAGSEPAQAQETLSKGVFARSLPRDRAALEAAYADPILVSGLRQTDPESLIDLQLGLAHLYAQDGLTEAAIRTYEGGLMTILHVRGQGHASLAAPMVRVARLTTDPAVRVRWLESALAIRETVLNEGHPRLVLHRWELRQARAMVA